MKKREKTKQKMSIRQRRRSLESLAREGRLFCIKHDNGVTIRIMYEKHCYIGRDRENGQCPYLQFKNYQTDEECRK